MGPASRTFLTIQHSRKCNAANSIIVHSAFKEAKDNYDPHVRPGAILRRLGMDQQSGFRLPL